LPLQVSSAHCVPTAYFWQPPLPSHLPLVPQLAAFWSVQMLRTSGLPAATATHLPGIIGSAQVRQAPVQALSQQTPSTQWLEAHSLASVQVWPFCLGPQVLLTQAIPVSQSRSVWQVVVQAPLPQRNGWQLVTSGGRQVPSPSQVPAVLSLLTPEQAAGRHGVSCR
jgi:hypothetical protein